MAPPDGHGRCLVGKTMWPSKGQTTAIREQRVGDLRYADRVVVFTTVAGRFRSNLTGTVMRLVTRLHQAEQVTVLLDQPTEDRFVVLEVPSSDAVCLHREPSK